jgi:hypothetical protein
MVLADLGLVPSSTTSGLTEEYTDVSLERMGDFDADVVFVGIPEDSGLSPQISPLPAKRRSPGAPSPCRARSPEAPGATFFLASRCRYRPSPFVSWVTIRQGGPMKYMLLIHQGDSPTPQSPDAWATLSAEEQQAVYADYQALNATPGVTPGQGLDVPETATTVRVHDGKTLTTDGPFVEIKEAIGGYLFFEADDLDAAIDLAARIPAARLGGAIEVRPIVEW